VNAAGALLTEITGDGSGDKSGDGESDGEEPKEERLLSEPDGCNPIGTVRTAFGAGNTLIGCESGI